MHVEYIKKIAERYSGFGYPQYQWVCNEDIPPWQPLKKPLNQCRVALTASGGIYQAGQLAFHFKDDDSFRQIPRDVSIKDLRITHFAFDMTDARRDPNCVFPLGPLRRLEQEGFLGEISPFQYTFMGGIYSHRKVRENLAPAITEQLVQNRVDVLLLVPVWPVCHQSVGLIARHAEASGISTVCLSSALDITQAVKPPRAAFLDFPLGHTSGKANEPALQDSIVRDALQALEEIKNPGTVKILPYRWSDDESWKNLPDTDSRLPRTGEPQFQMEDDRILYELSRREEE